MTEKKILRKTLLRERRAVSRERRACLDAGILRNLLSVLPTIPGDRPIFCYVGADFEIRTRTFLQICLNAGRAVCVPLCTGEGLMQARRIRSLDELVCGAFGLPEPAAESEEVSPEALGAVIVPGLAFDPQGGRMGRGGGFYDRYLAQIPAQTPTFGLCYSDFLREIPSQAHDRRVGAVITENEVIPCS